MTTTPGTLLRRVRPSGAIPSTVPTAASGPDGGTSAK